MSEPSSTAATTGPPAEPAPRPLRLGLVGHPVGHSLSPLLHLAGLDSVGLEGSYELLDTPPGALPERIEALRRGELDGLNVTVPHKLAAAALSDELVGHGRMLGAVNTLFRAPSVGGEGGAPRILGDNTDVVGLTAALYATWPGARWAGRRVTILGAGGAARAAALAALHAEAGELVVHNRTPERAEALVRDMRTLLPRLPGEPIPLRAEADAATALSGAALVLQCTPAGMSTEPGSPEWTSTRDEALPPLGATADDAVLYDLVYRPIQTPWAAAAVARGLSASSGLEMLVYQAALALHIWTGRPPPIEAMNRVAAAQAGMLQHAAGGSGPSRP